MKHFRRAWAVALALMLAITALAYGEAADTQAAEDITRQCKFKLCDGYFKYTMMCDGKYTTHWRTENRVSHGWISVTAPKDEPIHSVYICFAQIPTDWQLQALRGKTWEPVYAKQNDYAHVYIPLENGEESLRLYITGDERQQLDINEIFFFSEGDKPDWVQDWQPTAEKADLLFLSTHPDDELIFFCGGIPTYDTERGYDVVVAYATYSNTTRRSELLNGLWLMGVRCYPVIGPFTDPGKYSMEKVLKAMGGEQKVTDWVTALYRQYRPEVVVTQDLGGEYGHNQHVAVVKAAQAAYAAAADAAAEPVSLAEFGPWQVKKLYLHLWKENRIFLDWDVPLASLNGMTGREAATAAYALHVTQAASGMSVTKTGAQYDNSCFGLYATTVGADEAGGDFMEHIDTAASAEAD